MKSTTLKITVMAFLAVSAFSCKNNETKAEEALEDAAEASDVATAYKVDTSESTIKWEASKPTATHYGAVELSSGTLLANGGEIEAGDFTMDMNTITGIVDNMVKGNLTIKDQTIAVEFPAKINVTDDKLTLESEQFELDRTKWGINFGSKSVFPNLGDKFVNDIMKITIFLTANKA